MTQSVGITTTGGVKAIEDIRVGDRVVGFNPLATSVDRTAVEPDSRTWRKIALHVPKSNGDEIYCELLRPIKWFDEHGVTVGGTIELDTAELGGQSFATVLSVHEHPTISEGDGNVVTGTYQHRSVEVIHLRLENGETLAVTPNHPIWCEERHDFIEASEFEAGDHFRSAGGGLVRVVATMAGFGDTRVYNLEVNREHVYHVGRTGVLVHNKSKRLPDVGNGDPVPAPKGVGAKRGPKTDPNAPHNATIRTQGDLLEAGGNKVIAGGGKLPEKLIPTPGGHKAGRRPDILIETPNGQIRGRNVGKTDAAGNPIKRELEALDDLNGPGGIPTDFVPYD